jgi:solute carrier family 25 (mitochondrial citrate transporter), member 1
MAIRFYSFEIYKIPIQPSIGSVGPWGNFFAGLGAGMTESVLVVNPMEIIKIRLQNQRKVPGQVLKYKNAGHAAYVIVKEEGFKTLYKGVSLTAARQGILLMRMTDVWIFDA